ncbi:MAG: isoprenyl transferase [Thermoanaerobaculia bacterium]
MVDLAQLAEPGSPDELLVRRIDLDRLPRHVALIMDGNGRWANDRGLPRVEGHRAGVEAVRDTIEASARLGLEVLTLYAFSTENWKRPRHEIWTLMNLLKKYLSKELDSLVDNDIRLVVLGRWRELDSSVVSALESALERTRGCEGMRLNIALNYSGRSEIVDACRRIVTDWASGGHADIDEATLDRYLYTAELPDPDLLIRTSGEMRLSNFLLWQIAYTEISFTETRWPDFRRADLFRAILEFQGRQRRFGAAEDRPGTSVAEAESDSRRA